MIQEIVRFTVAFLLAFALLAVPAASAHESECKCECGPGAPPVATESPAEEQGAPPRAKPAEETEDLEELYPDRYDFIDA